MVKKLSFIYVLIFIASLGLSQVEVVHYFPQYLDSITNELSKPELKETYSALVLNGDTTKEGSYKTYFETSDQVKLIGNYTKGLRNGPFVSYYENGNVKWKRSYVKGLQLGEEYFFYPTGTENYHASYKLIEDQKVRFTKFYSDNTKWAECTLIANNIEGAYSEYFRSGKIASITEFKQGEKQGAFQTYYENGRIQEKGSFQQGILHDSLIVYTDEDYVLKKALFIQGKIQGTLKEYYPNTYQLKKISNYTLDTLNGTCLTYYSNGQLETSCTYKQGVLDQDYIVYHDNGQLNIKVTYIKGMKQGRFKEYDREGNVIRIGQYKNNELDGEIEAFYKDNALFWTHHFKQGIKIGTHYDYWENGKLKIFRIYDAGKIRSDAYYTDKEVLFESNKFSYEIHPRDGKEAVVIERTRFDKKGVKSGLETYFDKQRHGAWKSFYSNGKLASLSTYKFNKLQGSYITYYSNGKVEVEGNYSRGVKSGTWKTYDKSKKLILIEHFSKGRLHGDYIEYGNKKNVLKKGRYSLGKKEGWWEFYDTSGKSMTKKLFQKDKLIKEESK